VDSFPAMRPWGAGLLCALPTLATGVQHRLGLRMMRVHGAAWRGQRSRSTPRGGEASDQCGLLRFKALFGGLVGGADGVRVHRGVVSDPQPTSLSRCTTRQKIFSAFVLLSFFVGGISTLRCAATALASARSPGAAECGRLLCAPAFPCPWRTRLTIQPQLSRHRLLAGSIYKCKTAARFGSFERRGRAG
jgi:hypothetical protein